jgi:molecular chaperone DnaK
MTAFGIDLGTTNSCIAYVDAAGRPVIARNALGEETTPSVVYFEGPGRAVVGRAARDSALLAPHLVAQLVKREMGRADSTYNYHNRTYTPEMISALILREVARGAGEATGETVRDVVITVPAYFGVAEREATRRAGEIAGLNVLDMIAEPVAAALSYTENQAAAGQPRHILVFDLGGGTFDTTVIRVSGDEATVICTDGDKRLGGADWDERIRAHLLAEFRAQQAGLDPTADEQFMQELAITAETVKHDLSATMTRQRNLRFGRAVARAELSRDRLEELTADLLERALAIAGRTVAEALRRQVPELDEIVLVGGMTKMPAIAARLRERFGCPVRRHEPDLAVARGAATFALITCARRAAAVGAAPAGGQATSRQVAEDVAGTLGVSTDQAESMMKRRVTTVVPRSFGIKVADENDPNFHTNPYKVRYYIVHLLPANTPLPTKVGPVMAATGVDNMPGADVEVWEQKDSADSEELADHTFVGRGRLRSLVGLPKGSPINITFDMTETGLLTVHAMEPGSGREVRFELQIGGMDAAAVDKARTAVARHEVSS